MSKPNIHSQLRAIRELQHELHFASEQMTKQNVDQQIRTASWIARATLRALALAVEVADRGAGLEQENASLKQQLGRTAPGVVPAAPRYRQVGLGKGPGGGYKLDTR